jgi:hypothetical protein
MLVNLAVRIIKPKVLARGFCMPRLYTLGYTGWTPAVLADTVTALDAILADIRSKRC